MRQAIEKVCLCGTTFFGSTVKRFCSQSCKEKYTNQEQNAKHYKSLKNFLTAVKETCGCVDCGLSDVRILQFDHLRDKKRKLATTRRISGCIEELEKCEVVCANCHAIRTWERRVNGFEDNRF